MKTHHVVLAVAAGVAIGWILNNYVWGGSITPLFPSSGNSSTSSGS